MKPKNLKLCAPFKISMRKRHGLSNFKKPVFDFSLLYPRKNGLGRKSKCVHWIFRLSNRDKGYLVLKFSALHNFFLLVNA